jgi:hypothetical protein
MIRLLFVGDGERDAATNPHLVTTIIGAPVDPTAIRWPRLNQAGSGYSRKLLFAIRIARQERLMGVVATVDQDRSPDRDRLRELEAARTRDRESHPPLPTAVGAANPHAEAWLLDDPVAVRTVLGLAPDVGILTVREVASPKDEIHRLYRDSPRAEEPIRAILVEIAESLVPDRCQHGRETGFRHFVDDVHHEIGPLVPAR